ncbi:hypothetical protein [Botryobacter ruber]|uniref:hypothetical protein n=1 Tax=Botryobacter ruber TaxID=2171629 RepID=UPI000E0AC6AB|nr:hypothetical protein [Botryobacter ruber]
MSENTLSLYTIYNNPTDWPGEYVIKRWLVSEPRNAANELNQVQQDLSYLFNAATLEACREQLKEMGLRNLGRADNDDPVIVESWM